MNLAELIERFQPEFLERFGDQLLLGALVFY